MKYYSAQLIRFSPTTEPENTDLINQEYRMVVKVQHTVNLPPEIFLFKPTSKTTYQFISVCLPSDLINYPAINPNNTPDLLTIPTKLFRYREVNIVAKTAEALENAWNQIIKRTQFLVDEINRLDYLSVAKVFRHSTSGINEYFGTGSYVITISGHGYANSGKRISGNGEIIIEIVPTGSEN